MFNHRPHPSLHGELKAQAAVDAAADPNSSVTADEAERVMVNEAKKAGSPAYIFNPDASPEEKAAAAHAVGPAFSKAFGADNWGVEQARRTLWRKEAYSSWYRN